MEPVPHCRYNSTMPNQVNLIMDTFASIAMANETLSNDLLKRQPYGRKKALISKRMAVNIVGQSLYQLVVIFSILFWGKPFFRLDSTAHLIVNPPLFTSQAINGLTFPLR